MDNLAVAVEGGRIGELAAGVRHIAATQVQPIYDCIQTLVLPLHDVTKRGIRHHKTHKFSRSIAALTRWFSPLHHVKQAKLRPHKLAEAPDKVCPGCPGYDLSSCIIKY